MEIEILNFKERDIDIVFEIQQSAYKPLYDKYSDDSSNPYMESKEKILSKYMRSNVSGYVFVFNKRAVGAVRINRDDKNKIGRVSALCVLPEFQGKGIAKLAFKGKNECFI